MRNHSCLVSSCSLDRNPRSVLTPPCCSQHFYSVMSRGLFFLSPCSTLLALEIPALNATFVISQNRTTCFISVQLKLHSHSVGRHRDILPSIIYFHWDMTWKFDSGDLNDRSSKTFRYARPVQIIYVGVLILYLSHAVEVCFCFIFCIRTITCKLELCKQVWWVPGTPWHLNV